MNYRHAFHAGNFADVLKHIVLVGALKLMQKKDTPLCVIDAFAGVGIYDLQSDSTQRSPEYLDGIARLWQSKSNFSPIILDYLETLDDATMQNKSHYAGSPFLMASLLRPQDRAIFNELHQDDFALLRQNMREFNYKEAAKIETANLDAWQIIKAKLPPKERRGLIIIDPPFELPNEFERMVNAVKEGQKRFANGVYVLWHANKNQTQTNQYRASLLAQNVRLLWVEMSVAPLNIGKGLVNSGLSIINPPFGLEESLKTALPELMECLQKEKGATFQIRLFDKV